MATSIKSLTGFIAGFEGGILIVRVFKRTEKIDNATKTPFYRLNCPEHRRLGRSRLETHLEDLAAARKAAMEAAREAEAIEQAAASGAYERG